MNHIDVRYICKIIGDLSGVPVRLFEEREEIFSHFTSGLTKDPIVLYLDAIFEIQKNIGYFATNDFSYYGVVNTENFKIVIGPTRQIDYTDQELRELAFQLDIGRDEIDFFIAGMRSIVRMPFESILQMLCVINHAFSGEKLEIKDIGIYESDQEQLKSAVENRLLGSLLTEDEEATDIRPVYQHNSFAIEETVMNIVSHGDTASLNEWMSSAPAVRGGTLAAEQLRQRKNLFIVTATLASRAAIRGGLDVEESLSLSDGFIQNCEMLTNPEHIMNLQYRMILEYTERVERIRKGKNPTKLAITVANYVQHHLSEPVSVEKLAEELYMSRTHFSRKFKGETGETPTDFILKEKTEEAKRILRYTNKTSAAIGVYLGFSSQAHFSRVFKKYARISPHEYREKYTIPPYC